MRYVGGLGPGVATILRAVAANYLMLPTNFPHFKHQCNSSAAVSILFVLVGVPS